jgi:hypothetical protein
MVLLVIVAVLVPPLMRPAPLPPLDDVLPLIVLPVIEIVELLLLIPPPLKLELLLITLLVKLTVPLLLKIAPPFEVAVLPLMVLLVTVIVPWL